MQLKYLYHYFSQIVVRFLIQFNSLSKIVRLFNLHKKKRYEIQRESVTLFLKNTQRTLS